MGKQVFQRTETKEVSEVNSTRISRRPVVVLCAIVAGLLALCTSAALAENWPRELKAGKATIVMYQPQAESFEGDKLLGRAAVMVKETDDAEPVFGAVWMDCRVSTDRETRMVHLDDVKVTNVKFPKIAKEKTDQLASLLEREMPTWDLSMSLDALLTELELAKKEKASSEHLKNDPPRIVYAPYPAVLVMIDGEPLLREIENTKYKYVMNTPFFIVQNTSSKRCYLKGGDYWYESQDIENGWEVTENPPKEVVEIAEKHVEKPEAAAAEAGSPGEEAPAPKAPSGDAAAQEPAKKIIPKIIVTTSPAALIQTNGKPEYASVEGTKLLYATNTEDDILVDIESQKHYILVSGRWYTSMSLENGPWQFVEPDKLPADFANVPPESDIGNIRPSVAGTDEAREAVLENEIPQTAAVSRTDATVKVKYDGDPKFEKIEGTKMSYAINTDKSVLLIEGKYYCCDNAVWFIAPGATGPWQVCTEVPRDVQSIPPSCPVNNVKYVYVYDTTPEVVYVGYTPGYYGSYVYGGCVVYGTGYYYQPWYGAYYYPRPVTYGFSVSYNPWMGWGFGVGFTYGWFHMGFYGYPGGWWGPAGYYGGYHHGYYHGYNHGYAHGYWQGRHDAANRPGSGQRPGGGQRPGQAQPKVNPNIYNKRDGVKYTGDKKGPSVATADRQGPGASTRPSTQPATRPSKDLQRPATPSTRQNDVFTDKNGNVYRKSDKGWEQRDKGGWSSADKSTRDTSQAQRNQQQLNRQYDARERGTQRTQSYQQGGSRPPRSSSSAARSRPSGGGGRRR
ncbi:MAG: hypothetical protein H6Q78_673 [Candidatus Krumholzibacteriota bacterium]|nr:hypothetical protein [Candidatus Krumholzibacteriota bacterium]